MSCDESNVKKRCVESDDTRACQSTGAAPTNAQPHGAAPIKSFRDLIFSVSGTMPASITENSQTAQSTGHIGGKRKLGPNLDDDDVDASGEEKSDKRDNLGGIVNEPDVGITEFISQHAGFSGILKQR